MEYQNTYQAVKQIQNGHYGGVVTMVRYQRGLRRQELRNMESYQRLMEEETLNIAGVGAGLTGLNPDHQIGEIDMEFQSVFLMARPIQNGIDGIKTDAFMSYPQKHS